MTYEEAVNAEVGGILTDDLMASGASIQVRANTGWVSTQTYKDAAGSWPSGTLPHRLVPDRGTYRAYNP